MLTNRGVIEQIISGHKHHHTVPILLSAFTVKTYQRLTNLSRAGGICVWFL